MSGPRYTGKSYLAELLGRNLLSELKPEEDQAHNVILYESAELQDSDALKKLVFLFSAFLFLALSFFLIFP